MRSSNLHPPSAVPSRDLALDAARAVAVVAMMAAHSARLMPFEVRPAWAVGVLFYEPLIPSLFLLLVGVSLSFSFSAAAARSVAARAWYGRQVKRAAGLWVVALAFYVLEQGPRFPDFLTASGILATIAYAILITGALLAAPARRADPVPTQALALGAAFAVGAAALLALDLSGAPVFPLTSGNAPFLPLWLFAFAGALWGLARKHASRPAAWAAGAGIAGALAAAFLLWRFGLEALFTKPFGRSDAGRELAAPLFLESAFGGAKRLGYYNLRPSLALFCLGVQLAALALAGAALGRIRGGAARAATFVTLLGRRALPAYVLHLALLAALVVLFGPRPVPTPALGTGIWLGVVLICQVVLMAWPTRKRPG